MTTAETAEAVSKADSLRVAVASRDDRQIDVHFGHAERFGIYELDGPGFRFIEARLVEHYCQGGYGDDDKREAILRALADCKACFVARVGDGPRERLAQAGIEAVTDYSYGAVDDSLMAWLATHRSHEAAVA